MLSENDLIKGCKELNIKAQEALYKAYSKKMYAVCYYYAGSADDAMDLLHEGFIKVFAKIQQFKEEGSLEGWMRRIMVNAAIDFIKKKKSRIDVVADFSEEDFDDALVDKSEQDGEDQVYYSQEEMMEAVSKLPEDLRLIFNMFCLERYSHKEISDKLLIREDTCRSKLRRARNLLKKSLEELHKKVI